MSYEATPDGDVPGSDPVTETTKLRLVPRRGSGLTELVGGVASLFRFNQTSSGPPLIERKASRLPSPLRSPRDTDVVRAPPTLWPVSRKWPWPSFSHTSLLG